MVPNGGTGSVCSVCFCRHPFRGKKKIVFAVLSGGFNFGVLGVGVGVTVDVVSAVFFLFFAVWDSAGRQGSVK